MKKVNRFSKLTDIERLQLRVAITRRLTEIARKLPHLLSQNPMADIQPWIGAMNDYQNLIKEIQYTGHPSVQNVK